MLVLDGSPGAGKTTLLGRLLETLPGRLIVFPEAQPPPEARDEGETVSALLGEDRARIDDAARLHALNPTLVVASDRCHIGVLAYRYALAAIGRAPRHVFDHALTLADELRLGEGHRFDTILILRLDPTQSIHRRARHAHDPRCRLWYDTEFLAAYNDFLDQLRRWMTVGAGWSVCDAADPAAWSSVLPAPAPPGGHSAKGWQLSHPCGCAEPRSAVVTSRSVPTRLYTSAIHRRYADGTTRCLRAAREITADWLAADNTIAGGQR